MADETTEITNLIQGIKKTDPRLYTALDAITRQLQKVYIQLNPLIIQAIEQAVASENLATPTSFDFSFTSTTVRFAWSEVDGASNYEVRIGTIWDSATFLFRTSSLGADIDPLTIGMHSFLLKALTNSGIYSNAAIALIVTIPDLGVPQIQNQNIDNNVLLFWQAPISTFKIDHYTITKDGVALGDVSGTFFTRFETAAGTYVYGVTAVDIAENESTEGTITVIVNAPPDFELQDTRISDFSGTKTNTLLTLQTTLLLASWASRTFKQHFVDNGWSTIRDQINAGYPIYIQPTHTTGSYEEVIDYGTTITSIIVSITWNFLQVTGATSVIVKMAVSADNITYSAFVSGATQFYSTFRYLKFKLEFTGGDDKAIYEVSNLTIRLDVKREQDGGIVSALAADVSGTPVTFNKSFKDIDGITATPMGSSDRRAIVDFTDIPNPTGFNVFLFNAAGARVDGDVRWIARGIV